MLLPQYSSLPTIIFIYHHFPINIYLFHALYLFFLLFLYNSLYFYPICLSLPSLINISSCLYIHILPIYCYLVTNIYYHIWTRNIFLYLPLTFIYLYTIAISGVVHNKPSNEYIYTYLINTFLQSYFKK